MTPNLTRLRFWYNAPTPKFHHPMFTRSKVITLYEYTNKQTDAAEAYHNNAAMAGPLTVQQHYHCKQVANVQAVSRRIKPAVNCLR